MKKFVVCLLSLVLLISLAACGENKQTSEEETNLLVGSTFPPGELIPLKLNIATKSQSNWPKGTPKPISTMSYETIQLADASAYPALNSAFETLNADISDKATSIYVAGGNVAGEEDREDPMAKNPDGKAVSYTSVMDVRRSDNAVVSLLVDEVQGSDETKTESCSGYSYYTENGNPIALSDVANNQEEVLKTAAGYFANQYPALDEQTLIAQFTQNIPAWTLDYQGVSFYLPNPSGTGLLTVAIPFATNLFSSDYTKAPAQYAVSLSANVPANVVTADGTVKALTITPVMADDWATESLSIQWGGTTTSVPFTSFRSNFSIVHMGDGKDYLCADGVEDGDYPFLQIYSLTGDMPVWKDTISGMKFHQTKEQDGSTIETLMTDPTDISLDYYAEEGAEPVTGTYCMEDDGILKDKAGTILSGLEQPKEVG